MKNSSRRYFKYAVGLFVFIFALSLIYWMAGNGFVRPGVVEAKITQETPVFDEDNPQIRAVMEVQHRHNPHFFAIPEVVGTATGLDEAGVPAIHVYMKNAPRRGVIPEILDGVPVVVKITGEIFALKNPSPAAAINPAGYFPRPVPIGVSTGNIGECSAGTISARVKQGSNVYALSNNHVYALENSAPLGSQVLQPGLYDTKCVKQYSDQAIGTLYDYVHITFSTSANNTVDAAIALIASTAILGKSTPSDGYGTPSSTIAPASLFQSVQKYGRATSLTNGTVTGIKVTVNVGYSSGTARFVNQIIVTSNKPFIKAGDSGSLLVTNNANCCPVGLLFAGNNSGTYAVANPIGLVLTSFGVTIDGK
jgi:hypothetical protein